MNQNVAIVSKSSVYSKDTGRVFFGILKHTYKVYIYK